MKKLDERQEAEVNKIGKRSFYVMFVVCTVVIVFQLIWNGNLEMVFGETLILLVGGITCLIDSIKSGVWTKMGEKMTVTQNIVLSILCSGIFSVFYAFAIFRKTGELGTPMAKAVGFFFLGVSVFGFAVLSVLGSIAQKKKEKEEKKYIE